MHLVDIGDITETVDLFLDFIKMFQNELLWIIIWQKIKKIQQNKYYLLTDSTTLNECKG